MNTMKSRLFALLLLVPLSLSLPAGLRAEERQAGEPAAPGDVTDEDREVIQMLELLELMELLQGMEAVASTEDDK